MEMSGEYRIPASRDKVWAALNDPEILKACIPGCQDLQKLSDTEMTAKVVTKIGPVKATFNGQVTLSNMNPPAGYTISGEGKGGVAGFAKGGADVALAEEGDETVLRYTAKAQVGGKLAQVGGRLVDATAKQLANEFFGAFAARVGGVPAEPPGAKAVIADVIGDSEVIAEAVEERAEIAAGRGFLGGPQVWALIALAVVILLLIIFH
jgi:carbon monoxide dehydrogenase subunit G